jgi:hypothetical protein
MRCQLVRETHIFHPSSNITGLFLALLPPRKQFLQEHFVNLFPILIGLYI